MTKNKWSHYYMSFAELAATHSKDTTKVGAALIGPEGETLLSTYNGPPKGVLDEPYRFERPTKYLYASHAEMNLVGFAAKLGIRTQGCTVYVTHRPCAICARLMIQAGIKKVVWGDGTYQTSADEMNAVSNMFSEAGVEFRPHSG